MGLMSYCLGIEVYQSDSKDFICQKKYASDILNKFKMNIAKPIMTPVEEKLRLTKEGAGGYVTNRLILRRFIVIVKSAIELSKNPILHGVSSILTSNITSYKSWFEKRRLKLIIAELKNKWLTFLPRH